MNRVIKISQLDAKINQLECRINPCRAQIGSVPYPKNHSGIERGEKVHRTIIILTDRRRSGRRRRQMNPIRSDIHY